MIYQIFYKPEQKFNIFPFAVPYFNKTLTIFFENSVIAELVSSSEDPYTSVCSWKLGEKLRLRTLNNVQEGISKDHEVLAFYKNSKDHRMMAMANVWHKDFIPAITMLWEKLGYKIPGEAKNPIYQNHYSARTDIYKEYVNSFLIPAMELINTDEELNKIMLQPSGYMRLSKSSDPDVAKKLGMDDYPLCPFVLERCPSLWYQTKGVKIEYL